MIVGAGTAAMVAAMRVRAADWRVAVVDLRPYGGTCALRGCDPKKMMASAAAAYDYARRMREHGVVGELHIAWPELMGFKRSFTDPVPERMEQRYAEKGIDTYHGTARFTGMNKPEVNGQALEAKHVLLTTGAELFKLGIPGEQHLVDNEGFLALEKLPQRIVLVGGGYIAAEFSHLAARGGAQVTILQHGERMLKHFDPDLIGWVLDSFAALGIDVRTSTTVEAIEKNGDGFTVYASSQGEKISVDVDLVVHAAGRRPDFGPLDLEAGCVAAKDGRLQLNEHLQSTSNPSVYAAGDAAQMGPPLTPVSSHDAKVVAKNLLEGNHHSPDYTGVPSVLS